MTDAEKIMILAMALNSVVMAHNGFYLTSKHDDEDITDEVKEAMAIVEELELEDEEFADEE